VQAAALLSVGLIYQGTAHRLMAEILLGEIGREPGGDGAAHGRIIEDKQTGTSPPPPRCVCMSIQLLVSQAPISAECLLAMTLPRGREGYALAAGLALGLVTLGRGRAAVGLADLRIPERLRHYFGGGADHTGGLFYGGSTSGGGGRD
jgi:anaphase-promoting complex subunit 1